MDGYVHAKGELPEAGPFKGQLVQAVIGCWVVLQRLPLVDCVRSWLPHLFAKREGICHMCVYTSTTHTHAAFGKASHQSCSAAARHDSQAGMRCLR